MCGIVGYVGPKEAAKVLLNGLSKLEYRGYDSAGIAVRDSSKPTIVVKAEGKLINLINKTNDGDIPSTSGIGHTRWATHGAPTSKNAHPHHSDDNNVIGVHNGIIENYQELKEKLLRKGYTFYSDTDTEVIIKLVDYYFKKYKAGPIDAINKVMVRARGSYALALMFKDLPDQVWFAKKGSPLIVAKGEGTTYLASDVPAILNFTNRVFYVDDYECGVISSDDVMFFDLNGDNITSKKKVHIIEWKADAADKGNYPHYMLKEIEEQPEAIQNTINHYLKDKDIDLTSIGLTDEFLKTIKNVYIYGCGSAYHTGVVAQYIMEEISGINVRVELASEFKYREYNMRANSMAVFITQSGETKDTHEALLKCKEKGIPTVSICNVQAATVTRSADYNMYTYAGPEIAVATTKAYSCQLINLYLLAFKLAKLNETISDDLYHKAITDIGCIPVLVKKIIENKEQIQKIAQVLVNRKDVFFIGRGLDYSICLEGALKLKEITYINANAYAAGELKHGTISLIDEHVGVIALDTQSKLYEKTKSNMVEVKARKGNVLAVTNYGNYDVDSASDEQIYIPSICDYLTPSLAIIPLQMLAYYVSIAKGIDPDKPKNLAKSVTVE